MNSLPSQALFTPDQRYLIVCGRLWRAANPGLPADLKVVLVKQLMDARRAVGVAQRARDAEALASARRAVNEAKIALGERGPVWWSDGTRDFNRFLVKNSPYAAWYQKRMRSIAKEAAQREGASLRIDPYR